jgi:hypothetical protein
MKPNRSIESHPWSRPVPSVSASSSAASENRLKPRNNILFVLSGKDRSYPPVNDLNMPEATHEPVPRDELDGAREGGWNAGGPIVFLFIAAAGIMWAAMVASIIKMAYEGLIALSQWQNWLFR